MTIADVISRRLTQTCVYWGNPTPNGRGGYTYDDAVELDCRWEEMYQVVTDARGVEVTSRALVYLEQDVDYEGMLYLGTLDDLYDQAESSADAISDPTQYANTFVVKRFEKIPALGSTTVFVRKAFLTPSLSFGGF